MQYYAATAEKRYSSRKNLESFINVQTGLGMQREEVRAGQHSTQSAGKSVRTENLFR